MNAGFFIFYLRTLKNHTNASRQEEITATYRKRNYH